MYTGFAGCSSIFSRSRRILTADFRPVFAYVDNLIRQGEFANLKGLLYFTDGYGTFPSQKPAYDAAFVFLGQGHPQLPPWAIQLVLEEEELAAEPSSGVY